MAQSASALERKNLVRRTVNPSDKSEQRITLTRTGRREYAELLGKADEVQRILFSALHPDGHAAALAVLRDLAGVHADPEERDVAPPPRPAS
ncbi:MarR family winged helix-turn-helix transcriptional regulator [Nocardia xishanensis]|uniref:MarR family winged helix-turn-helix transcriptional regulator n=1 Tax=Nocardia xishanensis TaxID=238964 RepID=UPI00082A5A5F|nr:MarR family winged helix-turn-helix transcriptional regulator [Nocardia xishanensis]